jgi:hypothetical protein
MSYDHTDMLTGVVDDGEPAVVDSGLLLIVDPCHIPPDLLAYLTSECLAAIVSTGGDGFYLPETSCNGHRITIDHVHYPPSGEVVRHEDIS